MINEIIQERKQYRIFIVNRIIIVDKIISFIFEILFIEKFNHNGKCV